MKSHLTKKIFTFFFFFLFFALIYQIIFPFQFLKAGLENNLIEESDNFNNKISGFAIITDGDTVKINNNKIRLLEIDAPESSQTCFDKNIEEYKCGEKSTEFLQKLVNNQEIDCYYEKKDIYNRYLGKCFIKEISINKEMIKNGMAVIYDIKTASEELKNLQEEARKNKIGIWQGSFEMPKYYRKARKKKL